MAVNKNFVIKNGLEVSTQLILADSNTNKVGIGSTGPRFELDVAGGIGATDLYVIGISTALETFNVGSGGKVLSVIAGAAGIATSKVGIGTSNPRYLLEVNSPVSTGQTALYVRGDLRVTGDLNVDDIILDDAQVQNLTVTEAFNVTSPGISTFGGYVDLNNSLDILNNLNVSGITTCTSINVNGYLDVNSSADISGSLNVGGATTITGQTNIANLLVSGISTFSNIITGGAALSQLSVSGVSTLGISSISQLNVGGIGTISNLFSTNANLTNISGTNLNYSGIGTISTLLVGTESNKATISYVTNTARTLTIPNVGGNRTFAFIDQDQTFTANQNFSNINVSGISTLSSVTIASGIITASSGIVTYYGDGSGLINTPPGSPAGSTNQVQYNNGITFAASSNLTHDGTTTRITSGIVTTISGNSLTYSNATISLASINNISGSNLNYSGIGTIANFVSSQGNITNIIGNDLYYIGIGTIFDLSGNSLSYTNGVLETISGTYLNYSGIGTVVEFFSTNAVITNLSGTNINYSGIVTASSFVKSGGTSSQFLKADGSVDSTPYSSTGKSIAMAMVFG